MEATGFLLDKGHIRTLYCDGCQAHLDLIFSDYSEFIADVKIEIKGLPLLNCSACKRNFLPDYSRGLVTYLHNQATQNSSNKITATHKKTNQNFNHGTASFIYDSDDYKYIPGLERPWNDGFLTPVFFNREVLIKYETSPIYRLQFSSTTYGEIRRKDDFSMPFGINKNGKVVMWLGDIARLPENEQYYLRSENVESDHSIGSEFYDGQIECKFTELSKEDALFKSRSIFLEECFKTFNVKIAHLDNEVLNLSVSFNAPVVDTEKERRHVADTLNKIYIESFDNKVLGNTIHQLGGDPKNLGSIKRLQKLIELCCPGVNVPLLLCPFYVLYDLRVAYSHLESKESEQDKLNSIAQRLGLAPNSGLSHIYASLVDKLQKSFEEMTKHLQQQSRT